MPHDKLDFPEIFVYVLPVEEKSWMIGQEVYRHVDHLVSHYIKL